MPKAHVVLELISRTWPNGAKNCSIEAYSFQAGVTAGIDLALALFEGDYGVDVARAIARCLVVPFRRRGGQSEYSEMLALDPLSDRIQRTLVFAQAHLSENLTVERLATIACLSPRQFGRAFHEATGETPANAIERLRAEAAKDRVD